MRQAHTRLSGAALIAARATWLLITLPSVALFIAGIPAYDARLRQACGDPASCNVAMALSARGIRAFTALGVSMSDYAAFSTVFWCAIVAVWSGIGFLIFWRRSDDWLALLASFMLVMFNISYPGLSVTALALSYPALNLPIAVIGGLGVASLALFFLLFPDGRLAPRWTGVVIPLIVAQGVAAVLPASSPLNSANWPAWLGALLSLTTYVVIIYAQVYRYRRLSTAEERQQTKWVAFAIVAVAVGFIVLGGIFNLVFPQANQPDSPAYLVTLAYPLLLLLVPVSVGFAILRYRLWDIDLVIRRALVYSVLTAFVVGMYVVVVGYLGALFRASGSPLISLIATGIVAVLFQPLRGLLQRGVTRLFYGQRDEPYVVLSGLGQRLRTTLEPDDILPAIVTTVREALKLSYVAIEAPNGAATSPIASDGEPPAREPSRLPLTYQGEAIGALLIAPRGRDDTLTPADLRLLDDLTQQIGAAVHTARLTSDLRALTRDLRRSREQLVTAREEERRRLRRDLHDGLGPTLSAIVLKVGLARSLAPRDASAATDLLGQLETEIASVISDIRRLVYNLRPPALDELGLVGAIREYVARLDTDARQGAAALTVTVDAPESLPQLPAAVEVAAYRIAQEALTNVIRHARAHSCCVHLRVNDVFEVEVSDDGVGGAAGQRSGVGLASMRERAEELDGTCTIGPAWPTGTCIVARLPLAASRKEERLAAEARA
ncbi:MAG TPA: GAF domain-containing sensor histidine kinase [Ktedonobacterales bacterium]|nr:GAF domain-containing sensor histidine kinase [Ktedonobacterales bacterium]